MSLYGTGRKEGAIAVLLIGILTTLTHLASIWRQGGTSSEVHNLAVFACALGGMFGYRLLRVQGRSRYAAFLGGLAYGLSPWLFGLASAPRELCSAAFAPLALEAVYQCSRPTTRTRWLPFAGLCLSMPFLFGTTMVACIAVSLGAVALTHTIFHGDHSEERTPVRQLAMVSGVAICATANFLYLDLLQPWLGAPVAPSPWQVLSGDIDAPSVLHTTTMLRALGPFALWFAVLGVLRGQRHVSAVKWLLLALAGLVPTVLLTFAPESMAMLPALPAAAWFATVLATLVLAAAGLDDFLDLPLRRRTMHYLLLTVTLLFAPLLPVFDAGQDATRQYIVFATLFVVALSTLTWRRLGILRFKNVLTTLALAAFAVPMILSTQQPIPPIGAAPLAETLRDPASLLATLAAHPWWHYSGLMVAATLQVLLAAMVRSPRNG